MADDTTQAESAPDPPKVFISYSHQDSAVAEQLRRLLEARGVRVWFDQAEIAPGASIADFAWRGIRDADAVVFLLSPQSVHSPWVSMELAAALSLRAEHSGKKIVPVMVGTDVKVPPLLYDTKFVTINSEDSVEKASGRIMAAISESRTASPTPPEVASNAYRMLAAQTDALRAEERAWLYNTRSRLRAFAVLIAFLVTNLAVLTLFSALFSAGETALLGGREPGHAAYRVTAVMLVALSVSLLISFASWAFIYTIPRRRARSDRRGGR